MGSADKVRDKVRIRHTPFEGESVKPTLIRTVNDLTPPVSRPLSAQPTSPSGSPRTPTNYSPTPPSTPTSKRSSTSGEGSSPVPEMPDLTPEEMQWMLMMMLAQQLKSSESAATLGPSRTVGNVDVTAVLIGDKPIGDIISTKRDIAGSARVLYVTAHGIPVPDEHVPQPLSTRIRFLTPDKHMLRVNPEAEVLLAASVNITVVQGEDILPGDDALRGKNLELSAGTGDDVIDVEKLARALPEIIHCDVFVPRPGSPPRTILKIQAALREAELYYQKMVISACRGESPTSIGKHISELCEIITSDKVPPQYSDPFADVPSVENVHRTTPSARPTLERTDSHNEYCDGYIHYLNTKIVLGNVQESE